jgi:hypothetical protein
MRVPLVVVLVLLGWLAVPRVPVAHGSESGQQASDEEIREVVRRANSDEIYGAAYRASNPDLLRAAWAGEALLDMSDDIQGLRTAGQYLDLRLENMDFRRIETLGPGRVRVVTVERWLAGLYQLDGAFVGSQRQTVENRYLLDYRDDAWYIVESDQEVQGTEPPPRPGGP